MSICNRERQAVLKAQPPLKSIAPCQNPEIYIPSLAALLAFAHLLLPANDIALLPASLMFLFLLGFSAGSGSPSPDPFAFAHLALAARERAFLQAAVILRFGFSSLDIAGASSAGASPLLAAHLALCAAAMLARPSALTFFLFLRLPFFGR